MFTWEARFWRVLVFDLFESVRESFYCGVEGSLAVKQAGRGNCESYLVHGWFLLGWRDDGRDVFERLSSLKCSVSNDQSAVCQMISLLCVFLIGGGGNHLWKGNHSSVYFESNTGNLSQQWLFHFKTWYSYVETRLTTIKNIMEIFVDDPFWLFPASLYCVD